MTERRRIIPEFPGAGRLGRHVHHDEQSKAYPVRAVTPSPLVLHKIWRRTLPVGDQGDVGACFPSGVHIRMADGSERPIEDVRLLDEVVTAEGRTGRVMRAMVRDETGGLVRVLLWGHAHLRLTREHPVLTTRGYVPSGDLRVGDEVALPRYLNTSRDSITVAEHVTKPSHRLGRGNRWSGLPGREGLRVDAHPLPEKIELTQRAGRLLGLFLAEGACDSAKATWYYGTHEEATLVAETVSLLRDEWGVEAHVRRRSNNSTCVVVHGTGWTRLLSSLCGNGAGFKRPHPDLLSGPTAFQEAMLDGWLAGDGHRRRDGSIEGVSISHDLALAMFDIAQALGRRPVIDHREAPQNRYAAVRRPRWTITIATNTQHSRSRHDERHVWRKVRELRVEEFVGPVFNLSVEGDESYVAEGIGVHNCTGFAAAGMVGTAPLWAKVPRDVRALADGLTIYRLDTTLDDTPGAWEPHDTGSTGLAAMKACQQLGLITSYRWGFGVDDVLAALSNVGPVCLGTNWPDSFDQPSSTGRVHYSAGAVSRGGHEYEAVGVDPATRTIRCVNSWGRAWGDNGRFTIGYDDLERLLGEEGDAVIGLRS